MPHFGHEGEHEGELLGHVPERIRMLLSKIPRAAHALDAGRGMPPAKSKPSLASARSNARSNASPPPQASARTRSRAQVKEVEPTGAELMFLRVYGQASKRSDALVLAEGVKRGAVRSSVALALVTRHNICPGQRRRPW